MKLIQRFLLIVILQALVLSSFSVSAVATIESEETSDGFAYYVEDDGEVSITGYTGNVANIEIPKEIDGLPVTCIGGFAFGDCATVKSVSIPKGVEIIGTSAFKGCYNLTEISLPDSITDIGVGAFADTGYYLDDKNWEDNVLYIDNFLIKARESIGGNYTVKNSTVLIADSAFYKCEYLWGITIASEITSIGNSSFDGCKKLANINLPDCITDIGSNAFDGTAYFNNINNWEDGVLYIDNYLIQAEETLSGTYCVRDGTTVIGSNAFGYCENLDSVIIPDSVTNICWAAFMGCSGISRISIPDSVISIEEEAFCECSALAEVVLPSGIDRIANSAFFDCCSLREISIPENVICIDEGAFAGTQLKSIKIPAAVQFIGEGAFEGTQLNSVELPVSVQFIGEYAFATYDPIADVYFGGSDEQWKAINIKNNEGGNDSLLNAQIHYNQKFLDTDGDTSLEESDNGTDTEKEKTDNDWQILLIGSLAGALIVVVVILAIVVIKKKS